MKASSIFVNLLSIVAHTLAHVRARLHEQMNANRRENDKSHFILVPDDQWFCNFDINFLGHVEECGVQDTRFGILPGSL